MFVKAEIQPSQVLILKVFVSNEPLPTETPSSDRKAKLEPLGISNDGDLLFKYSELIDQKLEQVVGFNIKKYHGHL